MLREGVRDQVVLCDRELLVLRVARDLDKLHPVEEGRRDRREAVCGRDEEHVREVVGDLQVVVRERVVLLGVEDLEEGARRVAGVGDGEFVDLVEDEDRVLRPGLLHPLDDPAGERPDVGPPVPPDLCLILDAAEADPDVLPPQCVGDALAEARLPGAGRAGEEEDRALLLLLELHDREVLDDPLLDLLEPVVVALEHLPGLVDVDDLLLLDRPGEVEQEVEVVPDPLALVVLAAAGFKFLQLRERLLPHLFRHRRALDPLTVAVFAGGAVAAVELVLDHLELLAEHRLAIRLADLIRGLLRDLDPDLDPLLHAGQEVEERGVSAADRGDLEEFLLLRKVDGEKRHDEPHDLVDGVHLLNRPGELLGALEVAADIADDRPDLREEFRPGPLVEVEVVGNGFADGGEEPVGLNQPRGLHPRDGLAEDEVAVVRGLDVRDLDQAPHRVERVGRGFRGVRAFAGRKTDRIGRTGAVHRGEQHLPGRGADLELCPALRVDHGLEERYDHHFSGDIGLW
ncbi:hypothetical protein DSECCO2_402880 [anaerobic digester metagenome]